MKRYERAIWLATGYLLLYVILFQAGASLWLLSLLFMLSPIPVFYMVYQVLTNAVYPGKELEDGEEFGYQDADKNTLGMF
jgi:4-hydroxybenzoate polyprenyltransferase